jgi:sulfite exporter TauE/SafE
MSYEFYNVVHVIGVLFLFTALGALAATAGSNSAPLRKIASVAHGVALAVIFVAGFGLLARLGHFGAIPPWAYLKMVVWGLLALVVLPIKKKPEWAPALWVLMPVFGGLAVWLAVAQPFS